MMRASSTTFRESLSRRMVIVAAVPLLVVAATAGFAVVRSESESITRENELQASRTAVSLRLFARTPEIVVQPYLELTDVEALESPYLQPRWQARVDAAPELESLSLLDHDGRIAVVVVTGESKVGSQQFLGLDRSRAPGVMLAMAEGRPMWSDVHVSPISGNPSVSYVAPLETGAIAADLALDEMGTVIEDEDNGQVSAVVDRHGVLIYHPDGELAAQRPNLSNIEFIASTLEGSAGMGGRFEFDGTEYLGYAMRMPSTGWVVVSMQPWSAVRGSILRSQAFVLLIVVVSVGVALALAFALARRLTDPVRELSQRAGAVANGSYEVSQTAYRYAEFQSLGTALNEMTIAVRERQEEVETSEGKYRFLIESLRAVPWEYDLETDRFTYVGPQAVELLGYPLSDWLDLDSWAQMIHPEDRDAATRACRAAAHDGWSCDLQYRMITADGRTLWIQDIISVHRGADNGATLVGVLLDLTEIKEVEQLRIQAETASAASEAKSGFLASMSHELRTPLNSIIGFSGILLGGMAGGLTLEQRRQLQMIQRSGNHLMTLVNDILDLEKIEAGAVELASAEVDIVQLVRSTLEVISPSAQEKGLETHLVSLEAPVVVSTDEDRVRQILLNLLSNAVKFTPEGGVSVKVLADEDGGVCISVCDTGVGIESARLEEIFDEFRTLGRPTDTPQEGTGLGLAISRRLARMLGGDLTVSSTPGEGSVFVLCLPRDGIGRSL